MSVLDGDVGGPGSAGTATPPQLEVRGIGKSFNGVSVLAQVTFALDPGNVLGCVGENGAGKSTLMNILGGVFPPDQGEMLIAGEPYAPASPLDAATRGVAFIHQELNLFGNLTVAENLALGRFPRHGRSPFIDRRALREQARRHLELVDLDIPPGTLVDRLPPGERQLVEIARALGSRADLIILDEPTTSLTARETDRLFGIIERLRAEGRSLIYISHDLEDVLRVCDHVAVLRDGAMTGLGPVEDFPIDHMISLMVGRDIAQLYPPRTAPPTTEPALEVRGVSQPGVVEDVSFTVHRGELLGVYGLMGSGRTELARILFGLDAARVGQVVVGGETGGSRGPRAAIADGMAFVTENRHQEGLLLDATVVDNVGLASLRTFTRGVLPLVQQGRLEKAVTALADRLRIRGGDRRGASVRTLSGGNQQKVVLGKWLLTRPGVLLLDEPTRGVDVGAKHEIYRIVDRLAAEGTAVLMISSELEELTGVCDRILVMATGEVVAEFTRDGYDSEAILRAAFNRGAAEARPGVEVVR